jgi:ergothioneine biosynthesis protein EgtB
MIDMSTGVAQRDVLMEQFHKVRRDTELICAPLAIDDYQVQSITETSPPKWHIAHVTWFFEEFVLSHFNSSYKPFHPRYAYLFNSYYETVGSMQPRAKRGMLSRPTVEEIYRYRRYVDDHMQSLALNLDESQWNKLCQRVTLGLHHEQQHQELLFMDIKHNLSVNPLKPAYHEQQLTPSMSLAPMQWIERQGGVQSIGHQGDDFSFDNETPCHQVLLQDHQLASRLVTNGEYRDFIEDNGYQRSELWLADGWYLLKQTQWQQPLYWELQDSDWWQYTLGGMRQLNLQEPVCHLSFYEADAYARWAGARLPTESEIECMLAEQPVTGNFVNHEILHPLPGEGQWYGDVWEWTASAYSSYPGFQPLAGSMGEYNGKFMCNQMVLRGGCCVTPENHIRATYRNFYYPHDRWPFTGLRLARDL